jgi:hypothetical protein
VGEKNNKKKNSPHKRQKTYAMPAVQQGAYQPAYSRLTDRSADVRTDTQTDTFCAQMDLCGGD